MSTEHARLVRAGGEWIVEDRESRNGTFVNGIRVERAVVGAGDVVTLGRTLFLLTPPRMTPKDAPEDIDLATVGAAGQRGHATLDPELDALLGEVARVAPSELAILVRGETGSGKDVLARSVHAMSRRAGAFVAVNCGGIPAPLVESHFFGHVKGAFSGATSTEPGAFRAADGGTLFLDEVGDLAPSAQAALLRALQEREVVPVGATRPIRVDLRVLAATHQPLEAMVAPRREFRRRSPGAPHRPSSAELPRSASAGSTSAQSWPRSRAQARPLPKPKTFASPRHAGEALFRHEWPHNMRELEQCLSRALLLAGGSPIDVGHLPSAVTNGGGPSGAAPSGLRERDDKIRRELVDQLARHRGNLADVARAMGKARMQVHRWCKRFGIDPNAYRER